MEASWQVEVGTPASFFGLRQLLQLAALDGLALKVVLVPLNEKHWVVLLTHASKCCNAPSPEIRSSIYMGSVKQLLV